MKFALVICAVLSFAVFANGFPKAVDASPITQFLNAIDDSKATDEQIKCIQDAYAKFSQEHPELRSWLEDYQNTVQKLAAEAQRCGTLTGFSQVVCFVKTEVTAVTELRRLFNSLPENSDEAFEKFGEAVLACLKPKP